MRLSALLLLLLAAAPQESAKSGLNVVVLLADDLGYGDLGCTGHPMIKTPNLDRFAASAATFTHGCAAMPVCSPSRAALLTGRNPNRYGIRDWIPPNSGIFLPREELTAARLLKDAGYATAHFGKWHLNSKMDGSEPTPADHGFDTWLATQNNAAPSHRNPVNFLRDGKRVGKLEGYSCGILADEALRWLKEGRDPKKPFFLNVWFHEPHEPIDSPDDLVAQYPLAVKPGQALHHANVANLDRAAGRILAALDELKLAEGTVVLFTSDNGPETLNRYKGSHRSHGSPGPFRGMKLHVTEGGFRVPFLLRWPGRTRPGQTCAEPAVGTDLLPTLCDALGLKPPAGRALDGASLLPALEGKTVARAVPLYWQYDKAISTPWTLALREGPWKLLSNAALDRFELYDLVKDPSETRDLAAEHPERAREMAESLRARHREINVPR